MEPCPACKGEGVVFLRYLDERAYAGSDPDELYLPCAECYGTGQVAGKKDDNPLIGYFFAELKAFYPRIFWTIRMAGFASLASAVFVDFAPLVLLLPVVGSIAYLYVLARHDPEQFHSFDNSCLLLILAWLIYGGLFIGALTLGPFAD